MTKYRATQLYTETMRPVTPREDTEYGTHDVVLLDEAREEIRRAVLEDRKRMAKAIKAEAIRDWHNDITTDAFDAAAFLEYADEDEIAEALEYHRKKRNKRRTV